MNEVEFLRLFNGYLDLFPFFCLNRGEIMKKVYYRA